MPESRCREVGLLGICFVEGGNVCERDTARAMQHSLKRNRGIRPPSGSARRRHLCGTRAACLSCWDLLAGRGSGEVTVEKLHHPAPPQCLGLSFGEGKGGGLMIKQQIQGRHFFHNL